MKPCYCGHDCSRCITYLATIRQDEALRKESQRFYQEHFHRELPLAEISCLGGRSNQVMPLCRECPCAGSVPLPDAAGKRDWIPAVRALSPAGNICNTGKNTSIAACKLKKNPSCKKCLLQKFFLHLYGSLALKIIRTLLKYPE